MEDSPKTGYQFLRKETDVKKSYFKPIYDVYKNERNDFEIKAIVLETRDAANIIPITPFGNIIMVNQYRFGSREMSLELPGGLIDKGEEAEKAAERELLEETGHKGETIHYLGKVGSNPAFINGNIHHFLALNVEKVGDLIQDNGENIEVIELTEETVKRYVSEGLIYHPHTISALSKIFDLRTYSLHEEEGEEE